MAFWPWHHDVNWFAAPPCNCAEIEGRVREAIAVRDEMATWPTPLATFENWDPQPLRQRYAHPMKIRLLPGENYEVGTILVRGSLRFEIVVRLFDNTNCVIVKSLRG